MDFKVEGSWNTEKYHRQPWLAEKKKLSSRRSRMAKTVTFCPRWQPFNSFCFETLFFILCVTFFCFAKMWGGHGPNIYMHMYKLYCISWVRKINKNRTDRSLQKAMTALSTSTY